MINHRIHLDVSKFETRVPTTHLKAPLLLNKYVYLINVFVYLFLDFHYQPTYTNHKLNNTRRDLIMYYIIETCYVGPNQNQDRYVDFDKIEISLSPATTNSSHEVCISGWCGTTDDFSVHAHGEYSTLEEARAAISERFGGEVRKCDANGDSFEPDQEDVVEVYKPGKYAPMSSESTADWAYDAIQADIAADTTDERIAELVTIYETEANNNGYTLNSHLEDFMQERRQELRDELEDEA